MKIFLLIVCSLGLLPACAKHSMMPGRNELYSFSGPGSDHVERGKHPKIFFAEDSAILTVEEKKKLAPIAKMLKETPSARLLIVGYAPETGTEVYNRVLGEQRAQAVRQQLLAAGCADAALQTLSYGEDDPAASGRQAGRCVEFGIVR